MFKYMSADVAPLFAKSLRVRFTQPFDLNDPFELRPLIDFEATAEEYRDEADQRLTERFGTLDDLLAVAEKQMGSDQMFVQAFRNMNRENPAMGQSLMVELQQFKARLLKTLITNEVWENVWANFAQHLGKSIGIFSPHYA